MIKTGDFVYSETGELMGVAENDQSGPYKWFTVYMDAEYKNKYHSGENIGNILFCNTDIDWELYNPNIKRRPRRFI